VAGQEIERKLSGPSEALQPIAASLLSLWSYFIFTKFSHQQQYHLVFSLTFATCRTHEPHSKHLFAPNCPIQWSIRAFLHHKAENAHMRFVLLSGGPHQ